MEKSSKTLVFMETEDELQVNLCPQGGVNILKEYFQSRQEVNKDLLTLDDFQSSVFIFQ